MPTLYLIKAKAARDYQCPQCHETISKGSVHYRHDPYQYAKQYRGDPTTHWCQTCVEIAGPKKEFVTNRFRLPYVRKLKSMQPERISYEIPRVQYLEIGRLLCEKLTSDANLVYKLSPEEFEDFVCDRLFAMGLEPRKVGPTNRRDGGIDIVFWPRINASFPFLGAAQVKHHRSPSRKEPASSVRDFAGSIAGHPFNAGLFVSNTSFTPDAKWFARERAKLIRLRDISDIQRWVRNDFLSKEEWKDFPSSIEVCKGISIKIR